MLCAACVSYDVSGFTETILPLKGANILLTDNGHVKLGEYSTSWHSLGLIEFSKFLSPSLQSLVAEQGSWGGAGGWDFCFLFSHQWVLQGVRQGDQTLGVSCTLTPGM